MKKAIDNVLYYTFGRIPYSNTKEFLKKKRDKHLREKSILSLMINKLNSDYPLA